MNPGSQAWKACVLNQTRRRPLDTRLRPSNQNLIINTLLKLKGAGLKDGTLRTTSYNLKRIGTECDLTNPEEVKLCIANLKVANSYKDAIVKAYTYFATINQITWEKPRYKSERKIPTIPTKENIMKIISRASRKYAPIFKTLMETGLMPYELSQVERRDIDFEKGIISARGYKGHTSRTFKLTQETTAMLNTYFTEHAKIPDSIWIAKTWRRYRDEASKSLHDTALHNIRLYDLRHYYATTLYARTKDILLVKQQMGHKKIETTLIYTQLIHFNEEEENYTCKTASNTNEAKQLIEQGFDYVTEFDGIKLFRKRK